MLIKDLFLTTIVKFTRVLFPTTVAFAVLVISILTGTIVILLDSFETLMEFSLQVALTPLVMFVPTGSIVFSEVSTHSTTLVSLSRLEIFQRTTLLRLSFSTITFTPD